MSSSKSCASVDELLKLTQKVDELETKLKSIRF